MKRLLPLLLLLSACARTEAPRGAMEAACDPQVNADPAVRDLIMKGAGSEQFKLENEDRLRLARQRARVACLQRQGVVPKGGGVEPQQPL